MKIIGLSPPFLKIQKIVVVGNGDQEILASRSLGTGIVTQADTAGHYNELISLALCGQLMASSAAIHLATLFPESAPQAIEVNGIKPLNTKGGELWKPAMHGTQFLSEVSIVRKKMHLVYATSTISFGKVPYGIIEEIKFAVIPGRALLSAGEIPAT